VAFRARGRGAVVGALAARHRCLARAWATPEPRVAAYMALIETGLTLFRGRDGQSAPAPIHGPATAVFCIPEALVRLRATVAMIEAQPLATLLPRVPYRRTTLCTLLRNSDTGRRHSSTHRRRRAERSGKGTWRGLMINRHDRVGGLDLARYAWSENAKKTFPYASAFTRVTSWSLRRNSTVASRRSGIKLEIEPTVT
jgi:hypothetical protein